MRHYSICFLVALLASCASTEELKARKLPIHIAVLPMELPTIGGVSSGELPGKPTDLRLEFDRDHVTKAMSQALEDYCFSTVTILEHDDLDEGIDPFERERRLLQRAHATGADMIVELQLRYDPEIYRENSSTFWLNFPLFLFAGPTNWFVGDNSYFADVELTTIVYDLNAMEAGGFQLGDAAARVLNASSRYSGTDLDFLDRSNGLEDYALGLIIPSGYLSRQSASTSKELHDRILEELRTEVVQGVQSRRRELVRADWIAPVYMEPEDIVITRVGEEILVRGRVRLRDDSLADRVESICVNLGEADVTIQPDTNSPEQVPDYTVTSFEARAPLPEGASKLRIKCEAGSRDRYVRSYTFDLPR